MRLETNSANAEVLTTGLCFWLGAERIAGMGGDLNYLDKIETPRAMMQIPFDQAPTIKEKSHISRLRGTFSKEFFDNPDNDYLAARFIFGSMMFISGSYREWCFAVAKSQNDYFLQRFSNPEGENSFNFDLGTLVTNRLIQNLTEPPETLGSLSIKTTKALDIYEQLLHLRNNLAANETVKLDDGSLVGPFGQRGTKLERTITSFQNLWCNFAVDQISLVAKTRGDDISKVPMLQPMSITLQPEVRDLSVWYPFKSEQPKVIYYPNPDSSSKIPAYRFE
jgi:hypothetical protein